MSAFDRTAVRAYLQGVTGGDPAPDWRTCFSTDGTEGPTGIAPVCHDEYHERSDGDVYECCPSPVIEVESPELAEYLAALLNADRDQGEKDTREGESTQPAELTIYRASHESIVFGHYTTPDAAWKHCEAYAEQEFPPPFAAVWHADDDGATELTIAVHGSPAIATGYIVTPLTVASAYDEEAEG